jgi:hypothetical protein
VGSRCTLKSVVGFISVDCGKHAKNYTTEATFFTKVVHVLAVSAETYATLTIEHLSALFTDSLDPQRCRLLTLVPPIINS